MKKNLGIFFKKDLKRFCQNIRQYFIGEDGQPTDNENDLVFWIRD